MTDRLHDALAAATDAIETPSLAATALRTAHRRRARRRGIAAATGSSALVVAVVIATHLGGTSTTAPPSAPTSTITGTPQPEPAVQELYPRDVDDLPPADDSIAPSIPETIDPPATSPLLSESPVAAASVAVVQGDVAQVLGVDGSWRTVPTAGDYPGVGLSPDGTRLVLTYDLGDSAATVFDLAAGTSRVLPFPEGYKSFDGTYWRFVDEDTLFLSSGSKTGFVVDIVTGTAEPIEHAALAFGARNAIETDCCAGPLVLTDWAGGSPREVSLVRIGRPQSLAASDDLVAVTATEDQRGNAVVVADRDSLTPQATLNLRPFTYDIRRTSVLAIRDDGLVLLRVGPPQDVSDGFRVVAWDPSTGELSLVSNNPVGRAVTFADDLLRQLPAPSQETAQFAPPIDESLVQPAWNPNAVASLPDAGLALPETLAPDGVEGSIEGPGVAAADIDGRCWVLGETGSWRVTDFPEPELPNVGRTVAISPDGEDVIATGASSLWFRPVDSTEWSRLSYPPTFETSFDFAPSLSLYDDGRVLLGQYDQFWLGQSVILSEPGGDAWVELPFDAVDEVVPGGDAVVADRYSRRSGTVFEEWRGKVVSRLSAGALQSVQRPAADAHSIVVTRGLVGYTGARRPVDSDGLLALNRDGLTTRAFLPVPSGASYYSDNGGLTALGWLDPDTVLVAVRPKNTPDTTTLVTWNVETGELLRSASYDTGTRIAFAIGVL